ncbi:hypothetical protein ACWD4O_26600 [Streptomyces sp. NPDC002623]
MLTETTGRTAQDLAAELTVLRGVDWASVWPGPPWGPESVLREWCGRYGWEPLTFDRQLAVRGPSGGKLTFYSDGQWAPVSGVGYDAWHVKADEAGANSAVLAAADQHWPVCLDAAAGVLGAPVWTGAWDAEDFPEPPAPTFWEARESRLRRRSPYRLAHWTTPGEGGAAFVLEQSVSFPTWTQDRPGGSMISLSVYPAVREAG